MKNMLRLLVLAVLSSAPLFGLQPCEDNKTIEIKSESYDEANRTAHFKLSSTLEPTAEAKKWKIDKVKLVVNALVAYKRDAGGDTGSTRREETNVMFEVLVPFGHVESAVEAFINAHHVELLGVYTNPGDWRCRDTVEP